MKPWSLICCVLISLLLPGSSRAAHLLDSIGRCEEWIRSRPIQPKHPAELRIVSPTIACFEGEISKEAIKPLLEWLAQAAVGRGRPVLVVRSGGGVAAAGIDAMESLQNSDAQVRVVDLCASSCANYFFAGAKRRSVTDGALILFHGGYSQVLRAILIEELEKAEKSDASHAKVDWSASRASMLEDFDHNQARQDRLYAQIGVNDAIVHKVDRIDGDALPDEDCDLSRTAPRNFLFFTVDQLSSLGIRIARGRPAADPREVNHKLTLMGAKFEACVAPRSFFSHLSGAADTPQTKSVGLFVVDGKGVGT